MAIVDQYIGNLKQYRAIATDVGDQDGLRFDARKLHEILDRNGFANGFEIYSGTHQRSGRSFLEPCDAVLREESLLY